MFDTLKEWELRVTDWTYRHGIMILRIFLGVIFVWFGALKFYPDAQINEIVAKTIYWVPPSFFIPILAVWEIVIGVLLLARRFMRLALVLLFLQMIGIFMPLVVLPEVTFVQPPFLLTIEGQYCVKNILILAAAIILTGTLNRDPSDGQKH